LALLNSYSWPGNVRQLENTIFRAVVLCDTDALDVGDFPQIASAMGVSLEPQTAPGMAPDVTTVVAGSAKQMRGDSPYTIAGTNAAGHMRKLVELEAEIIRMAVGRYEGRMSEVARRLGIGRSTLYRKLKEFGLEGDDTGVRSEVVLDDACMDEDRSRRAAG
jgi:DNA-binding NtrC family response regulator